MKNVLKCPDFNLHKVLQQEANEKNVLKARLHMAFNNCFKASHAG